ncbi:MAG: EAL and HDOD domain-containing protein [Erysipelotrichaceae bacterium]
MDVYIARQPIFQSDGHIFGYELLYRNNLANRFDPSMDASQATINLLSDATTIFGLQNLTQGKPAFINFTKDLLKEEVASLLDPALFIIEILEDTQVTPEVICLIQQLKERGFQLALDDYCGDPRFLPLFPYISIIKVDLRGIELSQLASIAAMAKPYNIQLLAEKVETKQEANQVMKQGFTLLQGYYLEKPQIIQKKSISHALTTHINMLRLLTEELPCFDELARCIEADAGLSYQLLQRMHTLQYYRNHEIQSIKHAIVLMGILDLRRWLLLLVAKQINPNANEALLQSALLRGYFMEYVLTQIEHPLPHVGFLIGMFSHLDRFLNQPMEEILAPLPLEVAMKDTLLLRSSSYLDAYTYVIAFEQGAFAQLDLHPLTKKIHHKAMDFYRQSLTHSIQLLSS